MKPSTELTKPVMTLVETGAGYRITQIGLFDYADHFEAYVPDTPKRPTELVLEIILPGVEDPSQIDATVLPKSVQIKAPGHFRGRSVRHNFKINLPCEVQSHLDYSASWGQQLLTLRLKAEELRVVKRPFINPAPAKSDSDSDDHAIVEAIEEIRAEAIAAPEAAPESVVTEVKEAKFALTVEDEVVTVVLYVPRAKEETLLVEDGVISIQAKGGQWYRAAVNSPLPLRSTPIVKINPVMVYLIFVERETEPAPEEPEPEPEPELGDEIPPLRNPFIFDLEP
jgi:hypothetical protein